MSAQDPPPVEIVRLPLERLDELEQLWGALYEHHASLTPHLAARIRPLDEAWRNHGVLKRRWLADEPDSFVLGAELNDRLVGYAFVRIVSEELAVSWSISNPYADLAVLSVLPELRGCGIGATLMDAVHAELRRLGICDLAITVIATNSDAERFYTRKGAMPYTTILLQQVPEDEAIEETRQVTQSADVDSDMELLYRDAIEIYERARNEVTIPRKDGTRQKYAAVRFKQEVEKAHEDGTLVAALARIVRKPTLGFGHLDAANRPDLMLENLVLDTTKPYHRFFTETTIEAARLRMAQYGDLNPAA